MPFDDQLYYNKASQGDVGGVALVASIAISRIADALDEIRLGNDPAAKLIEIRKQSAALFAEFEKLTGWTSTDER